MSARALCGALLGVCSFAAEIQTQHAVDVSGDRGRFSAVVHLRVRTKPQGGGVYQLRTGPALEYDVSRRLTVLGGYYITRQEELSGWRTTHRPFGGVSVKVLKRPVEIGFQSALERFLPEGEPNYFRFRNRLRANLPGRAPYVAVETFVDSKGVRSTRYSAGLRRGFGSDWVLDFGYFFENRRSTLTPDRHMFGTTIHWRNPRRAFDPDY